MNVKGPSDPLAQGPNNILSNLPADMMRVPIGAWAFPIVVDVGTDKPYVVGTAFPITSGVLVTAKHLLSEWQEATKPVRIDRTVTGLQTLSGHKHVVWRTNRTIVHKTADLAVLFAPSGEEHAGFWAPSWAISQDAPREGEWVGGFGNVDGYCNIVSRHPEGGGNIEVGNKGKALFGVVKRVYKRYRDRVMLRCPCFEVGVPFGPGMSGGPVLNERGEICGIVSTGFEGESSSHVVTLWPSLSEIYDGPIGA